MNHKHYVIPTRAICIGNEVLDELQNLPGDIVGTGREEAVLLRGCHGNVTALVVVTVGGRRCSTMRLPGKPL